MLNGYTPEFNSNGNNQVKGNTALGKAGIQKNGSSKSNVYVNSFASAVATGNRGDS